MRGVVKAAGVTNPKATTHPPGSHSPYTVRLKHMFHMELIALKSVK